MNDESTESSAGPLSAEFEVTGWDEVPYDEPAEGPKLIRATVRKSFCGLIEGTSVAELLTSQSDDGSGYVASERFTGSIDGRKGTIVFQHGGLDDCTAPRTFGSIAPGSGTDELEGLVGEIVFQHDEHGARVTLTLM